MHVLAQMSGTSSRSSVCEFCACVRVFVSAYTEASPVLTCVCVCVCVGLCVYLNVCTRVWTQWINPIITITCRFVGLTIAWSIQVMIHVL